MRNFLAKTQGAMTIRPGTIHFGNSHNDTGAEFIEFIAATDDVALLELTNDTGSGQGAMRIWLGDDPHDIALLERPPVDTDLAITDTGWANTSTGGVIATVSTDIIPAMSGPTTAGVTITASSENTSISDGGSAFNAADNNITSRWMDTGVGHNTLPSWWNVDFGAGNAQSVTSYSIQNDNAAAQLDNSPRSWRLITSDHDTGTFATDTGKWTLEDQRLSETGWSVSQKRSYELPAADTGTIPARRHWRLFFTAIDGGTDFLMFNEVEMFTSSSAQQVKKQGGRLVLNASSIGALARAEKRVVVSDTGTEHSLAIEVERGPVTLRVGSSQRDDDYVSEASLGTGYHNLAFTPSGNFWVTLQSDAVVDRIVRAVTIGDSGTVELTTPWSAENLSDIRYDQSADVVYVDCAGVRPQKIERRGTGRSWSVVDYAPNNGPFLASASSSAKLSLSALADAITITADRPFFRPGHVGALIRIFHEGQKGLWRLGALNAKTDAVQVTGISDTGGDKESERAISFGVAGTGVFQTTIERSFDGPDRGFKAIPSAIGTAADTGSRSVSISDHDDNLKVWYRVRLSSYTSGVAAVAIGYSGGGITGVARVIGYNSNTSVTAEIVSRFSDTGASDNWQEGYWSDARSFPTSVALHGGRLVHAEGGTMFLTAPDDFENFDDTIEGDAGPIIRTLGSGPVDEIYWIISLARAVVGTTGSELQLKSSSLDEPVTPANSAVTAISTRGSANIRAVKLDNKAIHVQRSRSRLFMIGLGASAQALGDFEGVELTLLAPDLLAAGAVSIAVQRMPDTRIHCVLADGTVAILTYEPSEEVICWQTFDTDGFVERAMVLPGISEDAVYYHIRREVGGRTRRFLEKWAKESQCLGDTGLSFIADCAKAFTPGESYDFAAAGTALGWTASQSGAAITESDSGIILTVSDTGTTPDPQYRSPSGLTIKGAAARYMVIDIERTGLRTTGNWQGRVFYTTGGHGESASFTKAIPELANVVGTRAIYILDMGDLDVGGTDWITSTISQIRLDPEDGNGSFLLRKVYFKSSLLTGFDHLAGENVVVWGDLDTGSTPFVDLSADTGSDGSQRLYAVDTGGDITLGLTEGLHHAVAGLPYSAAWKSTKLAYGAQFGTALTMKKRVPQMGLVLYKTHNRGLYMGSDTGTDKVQPLPRTLDGGAAVDPDKIYRALDEVPFAVPGGWGSDSRMALRGRAPRPCTVLALVPSVDTNEK